MLHQRFFDFFPDLASKEMKTVRLSTKNTDIQTGDYLLIEYYCNVPNCDCRNVNILVFNFAAKRTEAMISYGWEPMSFYEKWRGFGKQDDPILKSIKGPALNLSVEQGEFASQWLQIFQQIITDEKDYAERLERHYKLFREVVDKKSKA